MAVAFKELKYIGLDVELKGDVTPEDVVHILDQNPYIELINQPETKAIKKSPTPINKGDLGDPAILETDCGWIVHYFPPGDKTPARVRASKPQLISSAVDHDLRGLTIEYQTMRTAVELFKILADQGWDKFKLVEGSPRFTWSTWVVLNYNKMKLTGFSPDAFHKHVFDQVKDNIMADLHKEISGEVAAKEDVGFARAVERQGEVSSEISIEAPDKAEAGKEEEGEDASDLAPPKMAGTADVSISLAKEDGSKASAKKKKGKK